MGLDDIMAELYSEGSQATEETAEAIMEKLENEDNYIPSNERVRREYRYVLLKEYSAYIKARA